VAGFANALDGLLQFLACGVELLTARTDNRDWDDELGDKGFSLGGIRFFAGADIGIDDRGYKTERIYCSRRKLKVEFEKSYLYISILKES